MYRCTCRDTLQLACCFICGDMCKYRCRCAKGTGVCVHTLDTHAEKRIRQFNDDDVTQPINFDHETT